MKGQEQVVTAILLSGILIGIVGSVYLWGIPLIQKNKDISLLQSSEQFMRVLDNKIKTIANAGGRDQMKITVDGILSLAPGPQEQEWQIELVTETQGTVYATDADVPLKNATCSITKGAWGSDEAGVLCANSEKIGENKYETTYTLRYVPLKTETAKEYYLVLSAGEAESAGADHIIVIENKGTFPVGDVTKTIISIDLI